MTCSDIVDLDDQVIELAGGGIDVISTKVNNLSLSSYDHVEVLILGGVGNLLVRRAATGPTFLVATQDRTR